MKSIVLAVPCHVPWLRSSDVRSVARPAIRRRRRSTTRRRERELRAAINAGTATKATYVELADAA